MNKEEQRILIAEACGYRTRENHGLAGGYILLDQNDVRMDGLYCSRENALSAGTPDYPNDLNSMHQAEKVLTEKQQWIYMDNLLPPEGKLTPYAEMWLFLHATAAQRAEAFCRTLWPERFKA